MESLFSSLTRTPPRGSVDAKVEAELVRVVYEAAGFGIYINLAVAFLMGALLWGRFPPAWLIAWMVLLVAISLARWWLNRRFFQVPRSLEELPVWTHAFRLGAISTAICWGLAAAFFLDVDQPVLRAFIIFIITGLSAGAARSLAAIPFCFAPYVLIVLTPIVVRYTLRPADGGWALALMTAVYVAFLISSARSQRQEMTRMYRTLVENGQLLNELRDAKGRAESANKAKSEFLATISHEIHTPLHGVLGMLQLLEQSELNAEQRVQVDVALHSGNALLSLLRDVLDFSRIESGRMDLVRTPFRLPELVNELGAYLATVAEEKRLAVALQLDVNLPSTVMGDAERLRQVVLNLLNNAVKFTDRGTIEFSVAAVVTKPDLVVVRFAVRDTGIGMPPEVQERLFEKFTQGNGSTTRRHGGVGLGLAIAQQLVWRMGGEIRVRSTVGVGSEFAFEIPLVRASSPAATDFDLGSGPTELLDGRVLVVEDDPCNQQVAEMMLKRWGLQVSVVSSGEKAVDAMAQQKVDVVLMDLRLPGMDGREATRRLRQLALKVPIVALTANTAPQDRADCLEAGMDAFLTKPLRASELHRCLRRWLRVKV